jgi:crossover junction endodeoxyribonuclease RusA
MTDSQFEYTVTTPLLTANAQRRLHFQQVASIVRDTRESSYILAKQAKIPHCLKVRIAIFPGQAKGRLADPMNHSPSAKAVIDGLVDAKVIPDDSGLYVERICMYAPERTKVDQLRVVIVPVDL